MNVDTGKNHVIKDERNSILHRISRVMLLKKENQVMDASMQKEEHELVESIKNARKEWMNAYVNFDYADDELLVDYYTYKIKACQLRYEYFIKKAKELGIKADLLETSKLEYYADRFND